MGLVVSPMEKPQGLGETFAPRRAEMPVPTPQKPVTDVTGAPVQGPAERKALGFLDNPGMQAFMLNMAANLLTNQGWGPSFAAGLEGTGRFATSKMAATKRREDEEYAKAQAAMRGRGGGGGGKSSGTGTSTAGLNYDPKKFKEAFARMDAELDNYTPGTPEYDQAKARITLNAMAEAGNSTGWDIYNSLSPEAQMAVAPTLGTPFEAQRFIQEYNNFAPAPPSEGGTAEQGTPPEQGRTAPTYTPKSPDVATPKTSKPSPGRGGKKPPAPELENEPKASPGRGGNR